MNDKVVLNHWAHEWLADLGLSANWVEYITLGIDIILVLLLSLVVDFIARKVILRIVTRYVKRSKNQYDDILLEKRVFRSLAHIMPALVIYYSLPYLFDESVSLIQFLQKLVITYMIINIINVGHKFLKALEHIGLSSPRFEGKPVSSYIQVAMICMYIAGGVFILSNLVDKSATAILTTFGAATAVILLIFRDTILGLVASIQISGNDMVRIGDWVSMPKYGADGDVTEINLTTVKVRNWDKTISTVPTYAFISDSFVNWRGMTSQGVRRIKRSLNIDIHSIKFVDDELYKKLLKVERIKGYLEKRHEEIRQSNESKKVDKSILINGRHLTNIGVFRIYMESYLAEHPNIAQDQTLMVRQLQPTEMGVPLEIYCFSNDIAWLNYEQIQSNIMDHLMAAVGHFELHIFQNPSGSDFRELRR
ncbi:mechanosensitive ion channel family protein [Croceimicrobium sp.]|uniref:mechanosensitive ion channel family protein n=1 Tax=Croceimicrobium sp. TaxID=2828340 RepID=UPI003BACEF41